MKWLVQLLGLQQRRYISTRMSIKASFKDKQLNTSEINKDNLFVSLVFYGLETCVKNAQVHDEGRMSYIVRLD